MAGFKSAFAAARKSGKKVFEWNGKSYNTKLAEDKPAPKPSARPMKEASGKSATADNSGTGSSASGKGKVPSKMKQAVRISTDKPKSFKERNAAKASEKKDTPINALKNSPNPQAKRDMGDLSGPKNPKPKKKK